MRRIVLLLLGTMAITTAGFGAAMDNNGVGTRGGSMGSAFTAVADDASAVFYNPAGLALIPNDKVNLEAMSIFMTTDYSVTPEGGEAVKSAEPAVIPGFFASKTFGNLGVGFGLYVPYGGATLKYKDYPVTGAELSMSFGAIALTPAIGYKLMPNLAVGLSASLYIAMMDQTMPELLFTPLPTLGKSVTTLSSTPAGYNANLGVLFKATDDLNLGVSIKTPAAMKISGKTKISTSDGTELASMDTDAKVTLPLYLAVGISDKVTKDLLLSFDFWYQMYSNTDKIVITTDGVDMETKTYYKNAFQADLGAEWKATDALTIRGGFKYVPGATEDDGITNGSGLSMDNDEIVVCVGAGYDIIPDCLSLNLTGISVMAMDRTINHVTYHQGMMGGLAGLQVKF